MHTRRDIMTNTAYSSTCPVLELLLTPPLLYDKGFSSIKRKILHPYLLQALINIISPLLTYVRTLFFLLISESRVSTKAQATFMALSNFFAALLLLVLSFLALHQFHALETHQLSSNPVPVPRDAYNDNKIDCGGACASRCQLSSRPRLCKRACGTCCSRCNCVPPGTSGNYDACPCYASLITHGNRRKCP